MSGTTIVILGAAAWRLGSPGALLLLLALPFVVGWLWFGFVRGRRALAVFAGTTPQDTKPGAMRAGIKIVLVAIGLASLMLALARPQADPVEESVTVRGRDVVFIVDVSRSMLSRDAVPNRLARAKLWINDLVNTLRGDRVGLVAFAGAAVVKSPLTMDYGFFRMALDELSPASVPRGGTLIGDAIRKAMSDVFEPGPGRYRDIVLITDGEDQGSFPAEAAKQAAEQGVRLIVIGIGSEVEGAPVPSEEKSDQNYLEYHGERVRSRLDQTTLATIAEAASRAAGDSGGGGVFLNVGTGTIDLDKVYHDLVGSADQRETEAKSNVLYRELFPYFLLIAGACLALEPLIGGRMRIRRAAKAAINFGASRAAVAGIAIAAVMIPQVVRGAPTPAPAEAPAKAATETPAKTVSSKAPALSADAKYNAGRELFLAGKYGEAAEQFRSADIESRDPELSARARFNLGQTFLKQPAATNGAESKETTEQVKTRLEGAAQAFRSVLEAKPGDAEAARNVEIARRMLKDFEEQQEKQKQQQQQDKQSKDSDSKDQKQKQDNKQDDKQDQKSHGKQDQNDQSQKDKDQKDQQGQQSGKAGDQNQQNADKLRDLAEQQERAADQTKKASEQKDAGEKKNQQEQAKQDQRSVNEKTEQQKKESEASAGEQTKQKTEAAQKEQKSASEALEKGDEKAAEEHQRKASELLKEAAQSEQEKADQAKQGEGKNQEKNGKTKDEQPKYDQTASQLLDKERKERDARQQVLRALRGRPVPVEKDW